MGLTHAGRNFSSLRDWQCESEKPGFADHVKRNLVGFASDGDDSCQELRKLLLGRMVWKTPGKISQCSSQA